MTKEILKDEILTEEELDNVAGGNLHELQRDADLMHDLGLISAIQFPGDANFSEPGVYSRTSDFYSVKNTWAKFGISMVHVDKGFNEYYDAKGNQIGRQKALQTIIKKSHSKLNVYDYL